ncbi:hypothetical protein ACFPU1_13835 [Thalassorhabdus alkalitolerans]|uniref:Uncharacterized protein n=1 Tax=Thalassorhabdus alkalitolerans TaxID=2282697 RepID=A0ABW0YU17_9BACI|nr:MULTISPECIES: hypothetical protein [Bacillaceae]
MLGLLINGKEAQEMEYILKRELEELLLDLSDSRIDDRVKKAMEEKYKLIFGLYRRFAHPNDCVRYIKPLKKRVHK